jgi:hypothetical protein
MPTRTELIRAAIDRLNEKNPIEYQTLLRQVNGVYRPLEYNFAQMTAALSSEYVKDIYLEWGRGTGKSTFIGHRIRQLCYALPRGVASYIAPTYQKMLTEMLPSTFMGLEQQGLYKDLHYFVGRKPPKSWNWPLPYQAPDKFDHFVWFYNGFGIHLISQDVAGSGRGLNLDAELSDESAMLDKNKMDATTSPALRGSNRRAFEKSPFFGSRLHASSTPLTLKGKWFTDMEKESITSNGQSIFIKADSTVNEHNLRKGFLDEARKTTLPHIFNAEYLNIRPKQIQDGFYPLLDEERHGYNAFNYDYYFELGKKVDCRGDNDLNKTMPLVVGVDWGFNINCLVVNQHVDREFRALKSMYVLGDEKQTQEDLFEKLIDYYRYHDKKVIYLWFDNSGNINTGVTKYTRAELAKAQLEKAGWQVILMTIGGRNPRHEKKHVLWNMILREDNTRLPIFRINLSNAKELWVSMSNAQATQGSDDAVKKDKRSESSRVVSREMATDLSDAEDSAVFGMFSELMDYYGSLPDSNFG